MAELVVLISRCLERWCAAMAEVSVRENPGWQRQQSLGTTRQASGRALCSLPFGPKQG